MTKQMKLGLSGTAFGVIVAVVSLAVLAGAALAAGTASVSSPTAAADGTAVVVLSAAAPTGSGIGNWAFDVGYDASKYTGAPTCTATKGDCTVNPGGAAGIVRFAGFEGGSGLQGTAELGKVTFKANLAAGACSDITLAIAAAAGSQFADASGTDFASPTFTGGKVCAAATAAPTTAAPTATPKTLPVTGGPADGPASASGMLTWLLVAAGLVVVSGGAWAVSRARREI